MLHMKVKWCLGFVLVIYLALIHRSQGESQVICPSQPIVATVGNDIIFLCRLEPPISALEMTVEWARPDLNPRFVLVWRDGVELESKKHLSFKGRTSVFINELEHGNISLKLSKVKLSDQGTYRCFIPQLNKDSSIKLDVGAVSSPVVNMTRNSSVVVLQCESKGWYPQPEVIWLDGEGNLLSAGPTEIVRGPDGLYTVSSRVTVEKRRSNNFTCKVEQTKINQIRETHIIVPDDFFPVPDLPDPTSSSSSFVPTIIGVIIGIVFILAVVFVVWKWTQNKLKNTKNNEDEETQRMRETSNSTSNDPEQESLIKTENEDKKMNPLSEETQLQCETEKETHQRETNNVLVQAQEGTVQQSDNEVANLSVPVKEESDQLLKEGEIKTGLDKRQEETEETSKRAEATGSAETCQQQSEQQSINNDGEGQPQGIIAGEVKKNEENEETQRMGETSNSASNNPEQESLIQAEREREIMKNEDKKMNPFSEETKHQFETELETRQRETNNVLVQTQEGTVQQSVKSVNEEANLSVPVKEESDQLLEEGEIKKGLDKREEETGPTSKRAEATASAETCQQQSEQQSVNNEGEAKSQSIIAGEGKTNEEDEEKKTQSTTEAEKEKETEMDKERERLEKQLKPKEREEKAFKGKISEYNKRIKDLKDKRNQLREQLEEVEKKLQSVNSEKDEMDAETQKVAEAEEKRIKNDLERKKEELQKDLQKTEKALQRNKSALKCATEKEMKKTNEKKEIIEKLEEIEKQNDSDDDL